MTVKKSQVAIIKVCHTLQQKTSSLSRYADTQKRHDTTVKKSHIAIKRIVRPIEIEKTPLPL